MGFLTIKYGVTEEQEKKLIRDGVIPLSYLLKFDIWQHYNAVKDSFRLKEDAVFDCQIHFKVSRETVYRALKAFK